MHTGSQGQGKGESGFFGRPAYLTATSSGPEVMGSQDHGGRTVAFITEI